MKKVLYSLAILALSLSTFSCGDNANTEKQVEATEIGKAEPQQVEVGKPVTMETKTKQMNAKIDYPGTITLANPDSVKTVLSKLTQAQGNNTYNCAVLFTGTPHKGKIWNFTPKSITVVAEWKYEDDSSLLDTVTVESQKFNFSFANKEKGKTKTVTYTVLDK